MTTLDACNPIAVLVYFAAATLFPMFFMNPILAGISLLAALSLFLLKNRGRFASFHGFCLGMLVVMTLINPIFQHNGVTVLFVMNDNPVTLEALLYGAVSAVSVVSVVYWFRSFSQIMTSDKLLYLFASFSPKLALLLSMTLRYIPLFALQAKKVNVSQKALGLYREDNIIDTVRGGMRVFSVMVTWTLENGIITADSMTARGYGEGKRTSFSLFRFRLSDAVLIAFSIVISAILLMTAESGLFGCVFYPAFTLSARTTASAFGYGSYAVLAFLPTFMEIGGRIKWHCLKSGI